MTWREYILFDHVHMAYLQFSAHHLINVFGGGEWLAYSNYTRFGECSLVANERTQDVSRWLMFSIAAMDTPRFRLLEHENVVQLDFLEVVA